MLAPWVADEVKTAKLNDKRLNARLAEVLSQLAARPTASIPTACGGRAEMVSVLGSPGLRPWASEFTAVGGC